MPRSAKLPVAGAPYIGIFLSATIICKGRRRRTTACGDGSALALLGERERDAADLGRAADRPRRDRLHAEVQSHKSDYRVNATGAPIFQDRCNVDRVALASRYGMNSRHTRTWITNVKAWKTEFDISGCGAPQPVSSLGGDHWGTQNRGQPAPVTGNGLGPPVSPIGLDFRVSEGGGWGLEGLSRSLLLPSGLSPDPCLRELPRNRSLLSWRD
jgi:hypothetical protein